jgi:hypothetical protein
MTLAALCLAAGSPADAAVAPSRLPDETVRDRDLDRVRILLQQEDVRARLGTMGMSTEEIESRIEKLDDAELSRLADQLDSLEAGRGAVGAVIVILVVVALVLLVIYLAERV